MDQWYAWSHLIPPATYARNITHRHVPIMDSYIASPAAHAASARDPRLLGGPIMDYDRERVAEVRELRQRTATERSELIELSKAIDELAAILRSHPKGLSLQPLYTKIPECLRGYVEIVYDLDSQPSFRFLETLLYRSPFYKPEAQSLMMSSTNNDDRPFVLSTPRFEDNRSLHLRLPFASEELDSLFGLKTRPKPLRQVTDMLPISEKSYPMLRTLLTESPPPPYSRYDGPGALWRYFGHACILVETASVSILVDPVLSYTYDSDVPRYTYVDLPDFIDFVLITHNHQDHVLFETLLQLRHRIGTLIVPRSSGGDLQDQSLRRILQEIGFRNVIELPEMDELHDKNVSITGIPFFGEHSDLDIRTKLAYLVRVNDHSLLFAADSCNIEPRLYEHVRKAVGPIEVLFLGMECVGAPLTWIYGPLLTQRLDRKFDQSRRLSGSDYSQASSIVERLGCREVYVYAMGQEPWLNYVMSVRYTPESIPIVESNRLIDWCHERGLVAERLYGEKEILLN